MNKTLRLGLFLSVVYFGVSFCPPNEDEPSFYPGMRYGANYGDFAKSEIIKIKHKDLDEAKKKRDAAKVGTPEYDFLSMEVKRCEDAYKEALGETFSGGIFSSLQKFVGFSGGGVKPLLGTMFGFCVLIPFIDIVKKATTSTFSESFTLFFKKLFGGIKFKVTSTASHCDQIFSQLKVLIREAAGYASREVGRAMNARDRIPDVLSQEGLKEGEKASDQEQDKEEYKCPLCKKSDGNMTFFFNCKRGERHGIHPVCAKEWFKNSPSESFMCPTCRAPRKFEVMEPDVIVSALTENLGLTSILPSVALSFRSAQKKIAGLIRQIEKDRNKNKLSVEKSLLVALHMDMDQICEIIDGCSTYKDFCNQDILEKLSIYSTKGSNNCKILNSFVNGNFDVSRGFGQNAYYGGVGSGVGGYGSNYGNYQS